MEGGVGSLILALEDDIPIFKAHFICFEAYFSILNNRYFNCSNGNHFWVSMSDATSNRSEFSLPFWRRIWYIADTNAPDNFGLLTPSK